VPENEQSAWQSDIKFCSFFESAYFYNYISFHFYSMRKAVISIVAAIAATLCLSAQDNPMMRPLPNDPAVKVGKLDNGLTYYIRHNEQPAHRAEFYLATNVGAIVETPDQDGLAHFLEHMCFNGTEHFPDKAILNYLRSIGAEFGRNVNASTGFEETQYMLNNIPVERETVVDTCLMILCDYAHYVVNDPKEIDAERGVIIEERRQRRNASWRSMEASLPYIFGKDSKYASCTLIGQQESLENFKPESLHNFYKTWYHPDMQAVVVVGDVDVDRTETKIKEIFGKIPAEPNPKAKEVLPFPANKEPVVGIYTDPELTSPEISMIWKSEAAPEEINPTIAGEMQSLLKSLIARMMRERFNDITSKPNAPFLNGSLYISDVIYEAIDGVDADVTLKEDNMMEGFKAFYTEIERMRRHGFTDGEFERAKSDIISSLETRVEKASTRKNAQLVQPLLRNFFDKYPYMEPEKELELDKMILGQLNASTLSAVASQLITDENLVILYSGPQKEGLVTPGEQQILRAIKEVKESDIKPLEGEELPSQFIDPSTLKGSSITKTGTGPYNSTEWHLSNGARVIVYPTEHTKDQILIYSYRNGGASLIPTEDLDSFEANIYGLFQQNCGIGEFTGTQASKMLSGKNVSVEPYISSYRSGVSGNTTRKDMETAFQLFYMYYAQPRFDADEYNVGIDQLRSILPNFVNTPNFKLTKGVTETLYGNNPRMTIISEETLNKASISTVERDYRKLFSDAGGLTVMIVGDVKPEEVKPYVEKYVGSIKAGTETPTWVDTHEYVVDGIVEKKVPETMETPKSTVYITYHAPHAYSTEYEAACDVIRYIMNIRYTNSLREEIGGTYGASTQATISRIPRQEATMVISFQCNPELCDTLLTVAKKQLEEFAQDGPTKDEFDKAILNLKKNIPEQRISNSYWLNKIRVALEYGEDEDKAYEQAVSNLTPEKVRKALQDILSAGNKVEYVMVPKGQ